MAIVEKLEQQLDIPEAVRIHWTGCPNSCGQVCNLTGTLILSFALERLPNEPSFHGKLVARHLGWLVRMCEPISSGFCTQC